MNNPTGSLAPSAYRFSTTHTTFLRHHLAAEPPWVHGKKGRPTPTLRLRGRAVLHIDQPNRPRRFTMNILSALSSSHTPLLQKHKSNHPQWWPRSPRARWASVEAPAVDRAKKAPKRSPSQYSNDSYAKQKKSCKVHVKSYKTA